jgi:WD40 repeat protein
MKKLADAARARLKALIRLIKISDADRLRLKTLETMLRDDGSVLLSDALSSLFGGKKEELAFSAFRAFKSRVNRAAGGAGLNIRINVDSDRERPGSPRLVTFTGEVSMREQVELFAEAVAAETPQYPSELSVNITGTPLRAGDPATPVDGRKVIRIFISYASADSFSKGIFMDMLRLQLDTYERYRCVFWHDRDILVGKDWFDEINKSMNACDFGLLLLSPAFFKSGFIRDTELPELMKLAKDAGKGIIPVALSKFNMKSKDTAVRELLNKQVYFYKGQEPKLSFTDCLDEKIKLLFIEELVAAILKRIDDEKTEIGEKTSGRCALLSDGLAQSLVADDPGYKKDVYIDLCSQRQAVSRSSIGEKETVQDRVVILRELMEWAANGREKMFALLGDYGAGKTFTSRMLARELLEKRKEDKKIPLPIYLDLRLAPSYIDGRVAWLNEILKECLRKEELADMDPDALIAEIRRDGALVIFDGLDERTVHMKPADAKKFISELWQLLPKETMAGDRQPLRAESRQPGRPAPDIPTVKLVITCRTHYFRDIVEQSMMLLGQDRTGPVSGDYRACSILPFDDEQILTYLAKRLGSREEAARIADMIKGVHNLPDLAQRPYTLSIIADYIPYIESLISRGEKINTASLYGGLVATWLGRDDGKHRIDPLHKRLLMEDLASALWLSAARQWHVDRLEQWLDEWLYAHPVIRDVYSSADRVVLKEDLRTATFIVRPDESSFGFAHSSLQEYFHSGRLLRLLGAETDRTPIVHELDAPCPSLETINFLCERIKNLDASEQERITANVGRRLADILETEAAPNTSAAAFVMTGILKKNGIRMPNIRKLVLRNVVLDNAEFRGLKLEDLDITGARLKYSCWKDVATERLSATDSDLTKTEWEQVSVRQAVFEKTILSGSHWKDCDLTGTDFRSARFHRAVFDKCAGTPLDSGQTVFKIGPSLPERLSFGARLSYFIRGMAGQALPSPDMRTLLVMSGDVLSLIDKESEELIAQFGTSVKSCAWSPDGKRIVTGGRDGEVIIWGAESGEELRRLKGHNREVNSCAWSSDGKRIVTGGLDREAIIWDAESGEVLRRLKGHNSWINSCAWSPDGKRIVTGGRDGEVIIWDAESGEELRRLKEHNSWINSCAWSPDGEWIVTGGRDGEVIIWGAESGEELRRLKGHNGEVNSCAWSSDGKRIVSGGGGGEVIICDAESGEELRRLKGHNSWINSCAWSPDGKRIVTGGWDREAIICDAESGEVLHRLKGHNRWVTSCAWSSDGKRIVSGGGGGEVIIWDAETGAELRRLKGHYDSVNSCVWSPDGKRIVTCGDDGTVRLWDTQSGRNELIMAVFPDGTSAVWEPPLNLKRSAPDAWRWLGLAAGNERYPIEYLPYLNRAISDEDKSN